VGNCEGTEALLRSRNRPTNTGYLLGRRTKVLIRTGAIRRLGPRPRSCDWWLRLTLQKHLLVELIASYVHQRWPTPANAGHVKTDKYDVLTFNAVLGSTWSRSTIAWPVLPSSCPAIPGKCSVHHRRAYYFSGALPLRALQTWCFSSATCLQQATSRGVQMTGALLTPLNWSRVCLSQCV
jgi:hypothetical protein